MRACHFEVAQFACFTGTKRACYFLVQQSTNTDTGGEGLQVDDTLSEPILGYYSPEPAGMYEETLAETRRAELKRVLGTQFTCFTGTHVRIKKLTQKALQTLFMRASRPAKT